MNKVDLATHIGLVSITFLAMIPSIIHHGSSLNLSVYVLGAFVNIAFAGVYFVIMGAKI